MNQIFTRWDKVDITPERPIAPAGQLHKRISKSVDYRECNCPYPGKQRSKKRSSWYLAISYLQEHKYIVNYIREVPLTLCYKERNRNDILKYTLYSLMFLYCITILTSWTSIKKESIRNNSKKDSTDVNDIAWFWGFDHWNDREGWLVPAALNGSVTGGALWLTIQNEQYNQSDITWKTQVWGPDIKYEIISPSGLAVPSARYNQIVIRLMNLSPETDGIIRWQTVEKPEENTGYVRFTMNPDCKEWQQVICYMDNHWIGTIDRIKIQPAKMWQRGDIWIDWIEITTGENKTLIPEPNIAGNDVVPGVKLPGISQEDFQDAFNVLDECVITDVPINGFNYPVMAPGGYYGTNWWQLDASLCIAGAKWVDQKFVEKTMRGFAEVQAQNPDGRIDLWGGSPFRGQVGDVSSLPRYFEAAYDVATRSNNSSLQDTIYQTMKKYLRYWLSSKKKDKSTGLVTGVFEETFSNPHKDPGIIAPVDLNVAVAVGCYNTGKLAEYLEKPKEAAMFFKEFDQLKSNINHYQWNNTSNVYYNYNVRQKKQDERLLCTTFDPLRLGIASKKQIEKLIPSLLDTSLFYWGICPLTTLARTEVEYTEATGKYDGSAWYGDVWTMRNLFIINGLEDAGKHDLASELSWFTIKEFNTKYCEYIAPTSGTCEGVQRYGWSASQYIQAIVEHLFGIVYNSFEKKLRIVPHIPKELYGQTLEISNIKIPMGEEKVRLNLKVLQYDEKTTISVKLNGKLSPGILEIGLPFYEGKRMTVTTNTGQKKQTAGSIQELTNVGGIRLRMQSNVELIFE